MRRRFAALLLAFLFTAGLAAPLLQPRAARAQDSTAAMQAQVQAFDAGILFAQALRAESAEERARLLDQAQGLVDGVMADYPESPVAAALREDRKVAGVSLSILAAARQAVQQALREGGSLPQGERERCLARPTFSCLYDLAAASARKTEAKGARITLLSEIAQARADAGEREAALALARPLNVGEAEGPGAEALAAVVEAEAERGALDSALALAGEFGTSAGRDAARARIVAALARSGAADPERAAPLLAAQETDAGRLEAELLLAAAGDDAARRRELLDEAKRIGDRRLRDRILQAYALARARAGDFREAGDVALQVLDESALRETVTGVASRQVAAGDLEGAIALARNLGNADSALLVRLAEARMESGDAAGLVTLLNAIDNAAARARLLGKVAAGEMPLAAPGDWTRAARNLRELATRARGLAIAARLAALSPSAMEAPPLVREARQATEGLEAWEAAAARLEIAAAEVALGNVEAGEALLRQLPEGSLWYDEGRGLALALAARGSATLVSRVRAALADPGDGQRLAVLAAEAFARLGSAQEGLLLAESIESESLRRAAFYGVAKAQAERGERQAARQSLERVAGIARDETLLYDYAETQARAGDLVGAIDTAERIASPDLRARAFMGLAARLRSPLALR